MDVTLLYFDGCPKWQVADRRLAQLAAERPEVRVHRHRVETAQEAARLHFGGSPSIQVDGVDLFAGPHAAVGLSCRLYPTPEGLAGAPTLAQLRAAIAKVQSVVSRPPVMQESPRRNLSYGAANADAGH